MHWDSFFFYFCHTNGKVSQVCWIGEWKRNHIYLFCFFFHCILCCCFLLSLHTYFIMVDKILYEQNVNNKTKSMNENTKNNKFHKIENKARCKHEFRKWIWLGEAAITNAKQISVDLNLIVFACYCRFSQHFYCVKNSHFFFFVLFFFGFLFVPTDFTFFKEKKEEVKQFFNEKLMFWEYLCVCLFNFSFFFFTFIECNMNSKCYRGEKKVYVHTTREKYSENTIRANKIQLRKSFWHYMAKWEKYVWIWWPADSNFSLDNVCMCVVRVCWRVYSTIRYILKVKVFWHCLLFYLKGLRLFIHTECMWLLLLNHFFHLSCQLLCRKRQNSTSMKNFYGSKAAAKTFLPKNQITLILNEIRTFIAALRSNPNYHSVSHQQQWIIVHLMGIV